MSWWLMIFLLIGASAIAASDEAPEGLVKNNSTTDHSDHHSGHEEHMSTNSTANDSPSNPSDHHSGHEGHTSTNSTANDPPSNPSDHSDHHSGHEAHTSTNVTAKDSPSNPSTISDMTSTSPTDTPVASSTKHDLNSSMDVLNSDPSCHVLCNGSFECTFIKTCECQLDNDLQAGSIKCGNDWFFTKYTTGMEDVKVNCKSKGETKDLVNKIISLFKNTQVKTLEISKCSPFTSNTSNRDLHLPNKMNIPEGFNNPLNMSAFSSMRQLNSLVLSYTYLTSLSGNLGNITPDLKHLSFNNNLLKSLPDDIFSNLTQIQNLSLAKNLLKEWSDIILKNLSTIEYLDLSENQIGNLQPNVFIELVKLKKLDLSVNNIPHIPTDIFSKNIDLVELNLGNISSSTAADIPSLKYLKNLKILWLHKNKLATVNADLVSDLHLLEEIHLEDNLIKTVPSNVFENNVNLKDVFFNRNQLELLPNLTVINPLTSANYYFNENQITKLTVPFPEALQRATTLHLSNNCISTIVNNLNSTSNNKITNLECVQCCLTDINEGLMKSAKSTVNLSRNKINKLDNAILKSMMHLDRVNLTYNRIMTMNFTLDYPLLVNFDDKLRNSTTKFDINNNIVICDCHLLPLIQFINSSFKMDNWVKSNMTFTVDNLQCSDPPHLRNTSIMNLADDQLVCNTIECPYSCSCFSNPSIHLVTVNCSSRGLTTFPKLETNDTVKLYLRNNSISFLPDKNDSIWAHLVSLHLGNNNISSVKNLSVSSKLKYLWLDFNQFQFDLESLKQISRLRHVWLNGNPWKCDCDVEKGRSLLHNQNVVDRAFLTCKDSEGVSHMILNITNNQFCETQSSGSSSISPVLIFLAVLAVCVFIVAAIVIFVRLRNRSGYIPS